MPRVLLPVAAMILTAMAIALLAGSILLPSFDPAARLAANGPAVVERFYAAVNTTITTGDTAELRRVAAPRFVAERPQPGAGPGHDGLDLSTQHPVPTGIAPAPDGGVYVGNLAPFPFLDGTAKVIHVAPDGTVTDYWTGLTAVVALAVGPDDALYALEMVTGSIEEDPFILPDSGRIVRQTGSDTLEVVADGLNFPIGLEVGPDGAFYISLPALGAPAGQGTIARLDLETGPASRAAATPLAAPQCLAAPSA